jgi:trk system potassium uptake protein TrkH
MRNRFKRISSVLHYTGALLQFLGVILLSPLVLVAIYWRSGFNDDWRCVAAFLAPAAASFVLGCVLYRAFRSEDLDTTGGMLLCAVGWLAASAFGALPFVIGLRSGYLDGYFEAMSGFTTTGITVFKGLGALPRSIIFWRALTQWLGGIGILSFFLAITFRGSGAHHIFGAESHKISAGRPAPGLFHTLKILWGIYGLFTLASTLLFWIEGMAFFDALCHSFTALSTGGFSPHDASIGHYHAENLRSGAFPNWRLIEYTAIAAMMLGGINFLVHYRVLTRDFKALWDNIEIRYWWGLLAGFTALVMIDVAVSRPAVWKAEGFEGVLRCGLFQVMAILTTTGFATRDIGDGSYFPALARQLFLVMMVIGGCVGSTGGGIKVQRVAILTRSVLRELFKLRVSKRASSGLVVDRRTVPESEIDRVAALFFAWIALLVFGGAVTALLAGGSDLGPLEAASGMFSALGNIGPCYISVDQMIKLHPLAKTVYILGMLAGRLEILPVLLLFSRRAWT